MKILSVNAGSSSLKFQMYEMPEEEVLISGTFERIGLENSFYTIKINGEKIKKEKNLFNHKVAVEVLIEELLENKVIDELNEIKAVGHRVVHGASKYTKSVIITEKVLQDIEDCFELAPSHNPANVTGIRAFMQAIPNATQVACFDTAFHQTMKETSYLYAVPYEWYTKYGVRKYGFHGMSHRYVSERISEILGKKDLRVITCHIGNGGSISAIRDGKCIDTSMGFTPNSGLMMGTRSGDIDVTFIPYVMKNTNLTLNQVMDELNKNSGYLGISGVSSDSRDIEDGIAASNPRCILAQELYVKRIVEYIAKYFVLLGGCDVIIFTAGIGENAISTRKAVMEALQPLGVKIDDAKNATRGEEIKISSDDSTISCYVIPTNEEVMIARDAYHLV